MSPIASDGVLTNGLIDVDELLERCVDDAAFAADLLGLFIDGAPALYAGVRGTAADDCTAADLRLRAAHTLKGNALNVAAKPLAGLLDAVELALRAGQRGVPGTLAALFDATVAEACVCRRRLLGVAAIMPT